MNRGPFIFLGVLIVVSLSWALTLVKPIAEGGNLVPVTISGERVPAALPGLAAQGRDVYRSEGCVACHTQQVRGLVGSDIERGWGTRQSMPVDYIEQSPVFTGSLRVGPDLANVGARRSDIDWHLLHFYNPRALTEKSVMPPFAHLFEIREIVGEGSDRALSIDARYLPEGKQDGNWEVVPTRDAEALAAYMVSLNQDYDILEAPSPEKVAKK